MVISLYRVTCAMVKGTMGIIGCPILEDEIVHSLSTDADEKNIYLVDTHAAQTFKKKLHANDIPFSGIGEWDFDNYCYDLDPERFNVIVIMNRLGLHSKPEFLRRTIEEQIKFYKNRFDSVALYYGTCGNARWDASRWASEHRLGIPVFMMRDRNEEVCDDCIGVAVGGRSGYGDLVKRYTGKFYVTPAIAENWDMYAKELEFCKGFDIMNVHTVKEVFRVYGYRGAVMIDTGLGIKGEDLEACCEHFVNITGLEIITPNPCPADIYPVERIYRDAKGALRRVKV